MTKEHKRPPLGVMPKKYWIEYRIDELKRAIKDYVDAEAFNNLDLINNWILEIEQLRNFLTND